MYERNEQRVFVIIPAFNEENSVGKVIEDLPEKIVDEVIVVNNNSNDRTQEMAQSAGATVLEEATPGYGRACLKGIAYLKGKANNNDIVAFIDADYSDYPEELIQVIEPLVNNNKDFVVGSRALGKREKGSMTFPQRFGNKLAAALIKLIYGVSFTDLGPFRAIKYDSLMQLEMQDKTYGWTVEMQLKAIKNKLEWTEVPVNYRKRIGFSKISGTVKGTVLAGYKIISTIFKYK